MSFCSSERFKQGFSGFVDSFAAFVHSRGLSFYQPPWQQQPHHDNSEPSSSSFVLPAVGRLVAIGDLHGDLDKTKRVLRLGGLTDEDNAWVGGTAVVVQVGDILDRGDEEVAINYFLERLRREAERAGGAVHVLNGNHEIINAGHRFRYATEGGAADFTRWQSMERLRHRLKSHCGCCASKEPQKGLGSLADVDPEWEARALALSPGGAFTKQFFAHRPVILQIGCSVFVHGGLLPDHIEYGTDRINQETSAWLQGHNVDATYKQLPLLAHRHSPVWTRKYSQQTTQENCEVLAQALGSIPGARRMIVGHTIQAGGISSACEGSVFRVDVGVSKGCGDKEPEVLEIRDDSDVFRLAETSKPELISTSHAGSCWERLTAVCRQFSEGLRM
mmetsp:Transcript_14555/g.40964  ORF Transcript_14555/g.40964 Transcript_14555/m.40964 type:complete len:389 (+) Transcript_14555:199-1365(+)